MGFWDVFYNATVSVQFAMLVSAVAMTAVLCHAFMNSLRYVAWIVTQRLTDDTQFAIRHHGELLHFTSNRNTFLAHDDIGNLMLKLTEQKNGPTDIQ